MTTRQRPIGGELGHSALGAAAIVAALAVPVLAQAPAGIPGVLAPGAAPELIQEGYTFTEGPVGTADGGGPFSPGSRKRSNRLLTKPRSRKFSAASSFIFMTAGALRPPKRRRQR